MLRNCKGLELTDEDLTNLLAQILHKKAMQQ